MKFQAIRLGESNRWIVAHEKSDGRYLVRAKDDTDPERQRWAVTGSLLAASGKTRVYLSRSGAWRVARRMTEEASGSV